MNEKLILKSLHDKTYPWPIAHSDIFELEKFLRILRVRG